MRARPRSLLCGLLAAASLSLAAAPAAPAATLLHWWKGDGSTADSTGSATGAPPLGDATYIAGHDGQAFEFDGNDDAISIPTDAGFYFGAGSFTLEGWAQTTVQAGPGQVASLYECSGECLGGGATTDYEIEIRDGHAWGYVRDDDAGGPGGGGQLITGGPVIADGAFHRITLVRDVEAGRLALYVDGLEVADDPLGPGASGAISDEDSQPDPFMLGAQVQGGFSALIEELTGAVDDVKLWSGTAYPDTTAPVVTAAVTGPLGDNGWYTGDAHVSFTVQDESLQRTSAGCAPSVVGADTAGATLSCETTSAGGTATGSVTVKRDTTRPVVTCPELPGFAVGASGTITATVTDALSGAAAATVSAPAVTTKAGSATVQLTGRDLAGNTATEVCGYEVLAPPAPAPRTVAITTLATLPTAKACVSRRRFPIRLKGVKASGIVRAQIKLDARTVRTVTGKGLTLPINLVGLPKGRFKVTITVTDKQGAKRVATRVYRTCVPKRR